MPLGHELRLEYGLLSSSVALLCYLLILAAGILQCLLSEDLLQSENPLPCNKCHEWPPSAVFGQASDEQAGLQCHAQVNIKRGDPHLVVFLMNICTTKEIFRGCTELFSNRKLSRSIASYCLLVGQHYTVT